MNQNVNCLLNIVKQSLSQSLKKQKSAWQHTSSRMTAVFQAHDFEHSYQVRC